MTKDEIKLREKNLIELTSAFCKEHLNEEYSNVCEKLILKMGRKREVPFSTGKLESWAAGIVHAIASINFAFDKSAKQYISPTVLSKHFGFALNTISSKSKTIRDMFKLSPFSPEFSINSVKEANPFNQMVMVDGFIVPISSLPEDLQEEVKRVRAAGKDISYTSY